MKRLAFFIIVLAWVFDLIVGSAALFDKGYDMIAVINIIVDVIFIPYMIDMYYRLK